MPLDENGAREWRAQNVRTKTGKQFDQTTRLRAAQADLAEIEAAERRAELAPVEDMQIAWNEAFVILRSETEAIAGRCAAQLSAMSDQAEIRPLLLNEIRRALTSAADRIEAWARSIASGAASTSAADPNTGPVGRPN